MKVLVLNCGSSSIKYQLYDMPAGTVLAKGLIQRIGEPKSSGAQKAGDKGIGFERPILNHDEAIAAITQMLVDPERGAIQSMREIGACGHRVVHGGEAVSGSVIIDDRIEQVITDYCDLAPLHNPPNLIGIRAAKKILGTIPQVACFDTAFHQTIPETAYLYALPYELYEKFRVRKYGFHGTSHRYVAQRAATLLGKKPQELDAITCHLGNGCSMAAVKKGQCVDTSMGLTPLEGLVMGTRPGDFDPAIIFYLERKGYTCGDLDTLMNKKAGLIGISGISNDVRDLEEKAVAGNARAQLALDIFAYRIKKYIGAYLAALNGAECVIFTGGVGENGVPMRQRILSGLDGIGILLDQDRNRAARGCEAEIQAAGSKIKILVVPTDEEGSIARDTFQLVGGK
jgi:acetate kinase